MRVLFVYTNIAGYHENCYAPGLAYVVAATRRAGHQASVQIVRSWDEGTDLSQAVSDFRPDVVGFSAVSSQFDVVARLASQIREADEELLLVCGGVHPTVHPECIRDAAALNAVFVGESELAFVEFLDLVQNGEDHSRADNLAFMRNGVLVRNPLKPLVDDLDSLPPPDKEVYPYREAIEVAGYAPFFFSRGCPYLCAYCCNHALARTYGLRQSSIRYRSPESSIREIEDALARFAMPRIFVRDDIFGLHPTWRREFCELFALRIGLPFSVFARAEVVSESYVSDLTRAGCKAVTLAVESGNEYIRKEVMNCLHRPIVIAGIGST